MTHKEIEEYRQRLAEIIKRLLLDRRLIVACWLALLLCGFWLVDKWPCFAYIVGYSFPLIFGHLFIKRVVDLLWENIGWVKSATQADEKGPRPYPWQSALIGCIESVLYVSSFLLDKEQFIAIWLALKVAGQWGRWRKDEPYNGKFIAGRRFALRLSRPL